MSGHSCGDSWCPSIESDPEHYGVGMVGVVSCALGFEFDMFLIVRDPATGALLWASDAGCSCPLPFDGVAPDTMRRGDALGCLTDLQAWVRVGYSNDRGMAIRAAADAAWFQGLLAEAGYGKAVIFA